MDREAWWVIVHGVAKSRTRLSHTNTHTHTHTHTHASEVIMLKIFQARLQQYMNHEFPDVQAGFRKSSGTRDPIANIYWIIEKAREFQKSICFCFIDYAKAYDCVDHDKLRKIFGNTRPSYLPPKKFVCRTGHGTTD